MPAPINLIGQKFGKLTVVSVVKSNNGNLWVCICDCGKIKEKAVSGFQLKSGKITNCGCNSNVGKGRQTHGQYQTKLYKVWSSMKHRCLSNNDSSYGNYGGRGISVCDDWAKFEAFYNWSHENGYEEGLTLERKDVNGNYEPSNCEWIPKSKQSENTRKCKFITYQGETKILKHWARDLNIPYHLLQSRITNNGWSVERAFTTPVIPFELCHAKIIAYRGETKSIAEWSRIFGIDHKKLRRRLYDGWDFEKAIR